MKKGVCGRRTSLSGSRRYTRRTEFGYSLVEILALTGALFVIASVAYGAVTHVTEAARTEKLESDVKTLNRAVAIYVSNGGSLEGANTAQKVLRRLRKSVSESTANRMPGLSSAMIDQRIWVEMQSKREWEKEVPRGYWDYDAKKFTVADSGPKGIKRFVLNDDLADDDFERENRRAAMLYASNDGWVWDYQDRTISDRSEPTVVTTVPTIGGVPSGGGPTPPPSTPPSPGVLIPPIFSLPGGTYSIANYDLIVDLTNINAAGISELYYGFDGGPLERYTGPITVPPGVVLDAKAVALDTGSYSDSSKVSQNYVAEPVTLSPPVIDSDRDNFGFFFNVDIEVTLTESNEPETADIRYRLNGGSWMTYDGKFDLKRDDHPGGVILEAQSVSSGSEYYLSSAVSVREYSNESLDLNGTASGVYHDPHGSSGMVTNLPAGTSSSNFSWGNASGWGLSQSWMEFTGGPFGEVAAGERFSLGQMTYYNGTIRSGSGADTVELTVNLELELNGSVFHPYFDFTFDLINTPNNRDPGNPWPDADYVRIGDGRASRTLVINGYEYEFRLEFGETSDDGFSQFDEFHVLEERDASVNVFGTFVSLGPVAAPEVNGPSSLEGGSLESGSLLESNNATAPSDGDGATAPETGGTVIYQNDGRVDSKEAAVGFAEVAAAAAETAETEAGVAESKADQAEIAANGAIAKLTVGDLPGAQELALDADVHATDAENAEANAQGAKSVAHTAAIDADEQASLDPFAAVDAEAAVASYYEAADAATRAHNAAYRARNASNSANAAVGANDPNDATNPPADSDAAALNDPNYVPEGTTGGGTDPANTDGGNTTPYDADPVIVP